MTAIPDRSGAGIGLCTDLQKKLQGSWTGTDRIFRTSSPPHCLQGPENYPTDAFRNHYSNMAKNAVIVTVDMLWGDYPKKYSNPPRGADHFGDHK